MAEQLKDRDEIQEAVRNRYADAAKVAEYAAKNGLSPYEAVAYQGLGAMLA